MERRTQTATAVTASEVDDVARSAERIVANLIASTKKKVVLEERTPCFMVQL